jgi:hypothetical protein
MLEEKFGKVATVEPTAKRPWWRSGRPPLPGGVLLIQGIQRGGTAEEGEKDRDGKNASHRNAVFPPGRGS